VTQPVASDALAWRVVVQWVEWIVAKPLLIIAVEIELMSTRYPCGIIAELQLHHPVCEGGMRGEVMIK
jgi:hypothetical protein